MYARPPKHLTFSSSGVVDSFEDADRQERLLQGKILKVNASLSLLRFFAKVGKDSNASFIFVKHILYVKYDYLFAQIVYLEVTREVHFYFMLTLTVW